MSIPLRRTPATGPGPCTGLSEFQTGETTDDAFISQSSVVQHEAAFDHDNISNTGTNSHTALDTHLADGTIHRTLEALQDSVAAMLVAGTGVTLTYNDPAGTITIDVAAGGGNTLPFPYERYYAVNNSPTVTTGTVNVLHLQMQEAVTGGVYKLSWSYSYSKNNTTQDIIIELEDVAGVDGNPVDPTIVHRLQEESKDAAGTSRVGGTLTNQEKAASGFIDVNLPAATQTFNLTVRNLNAGNAVAIWDARLELLRVG